MSTDQTPQAGNPMADADERAKSQAEGADKRDDGFTRMLLVADVRGQIGTANFETRSMAIADSAEVLVWFDRQRPVHTEGDDACECLACAAEHRWDQLNCPACGGSGHVDDLDIVGAARTLGIRPGVLDWARKIEACLRRNEQPPKNKGPWHEDTMSDAYRGLLREREEVSQATMDYSIGLTRPASALEPYIEALIVELVDESTAAMIMADVVRVGGPSKDRGWTL